jgi:hypothetical protein
MGQNHTKEIADSGNETDGEGSDDSIYADGTCGSPPINYMPKPNALQLQFLEYVDAGNVDQLTAFVKQHQVSTTIACFHT